LASINQNGALELLCESALERKVRKLVCAGQLGLKTAQTEIASNWIEAYKKYVCKSPLAPIVHETKTAPETTANEVWVNTRSGKYWKLVHRVISRGRPAVGQLADFQGGPSGTGSSDEHI
jgi:hypothetical protein